jgi:hypothetical protein
LACVSKPIVASESYDIQEGEQNGCMIKGGIEEVEGMLEEKM